MFFKNNPLYRLYIDGSMYVPLRDLRIISIAASLKGNLHRPAQRHVQADLFVKQLKCVFVLTWSSPLCL